MDKMALYKVMDRSTGLFFEGGIHGRFVGKGKTYKQINHAKTSLRYVTDKRRDLVIIKYNYTLGDIEEIEV